MNSNHPPAVNETRLRVRYAETDQMGVVYHSNHLIWFEVGRVELLRQLGFSYRDMEREDGVMLAVAEARCRYAFPARFDDEVVVAIELPKGGRFNGRSMARSMTTCKRMDAHRQRGYVSMAEASPGR